MRFAFGAESAGREVVAGVLSDGTGKAWTTPSFIAEAAGPVRALGLGADPDGTLLAAFAAGADAQSTATSLRAPKTAAARGSPRSTSPAP